MRLELRKELWNKFCSELVIAYLHHQQCITSRSHPAQRMDKKKKSNILRQLYKLETKGTLTLHSHRHSGRFSINYNLPFREKSDSR